MTFEPCSFLYGAARERNGETFRHDISGRRTIIVQSLAGALHVLRRNASNYHKAQTPFQQVFGPTRLTEDEEGWIKREKVSQKYLAKFNANLLTSNSARHARTLVERLASSSTDGRLDQLPFDETTMKVLCDTLLHGRLTDQVSELLADISTMLDYVSTYSFIFKANSRIDISPDKTRALAAVRQRIMNRLNSIRNDLPDGDNLLTSLDAADRSQESPITFHHELLMMLAAGSDTSAFALGCSCLALAENPEVQEAVRREVSGLTDQQLEDPKVVNRLPLLSGFVEEVLRLYPPVPMLARSALDSDEVDGQCINPDDLVLVSIVGIHRDARSWQHPDRFLLNRQSFEDGRSARAIPFSTGPRICGGARFAMLELKAVMATVLRHLQFEASDVEPGPFQWRTSMRSLGHPVNVRHIH